MTSAQLYHRAVYAPVPLFRSPGVMRVRYTRHARQAALDDRYGDLTPFLRHYVDFDVAEIVEVELTDGVISKRVIRLPLPGGFVLVMVVSGIGRVITVWANRAADRHHSLERSKFVQCRAALRAEELVLH